jgi:CHAT domain-containing protein/TRADD-N domain-containing protein
MKYADFVLHFETSPTGTYIVRVLDSPAGEGWSTLGSDLSPGESVRIIAALALSLHGENEVGTEELGARLYRSLFSGSVRSLYERSVGAASRDMEQGLRIVLRLDPADRHLAFLYKIPWEALYSEETREFLSLRRSLSITRRLQVARPAGVLPVAGPLRILLVVSEPIGLPPLDLKEERSHIETSLGEQGGFFVSVLECASPQALRSRLLADKFHVVHFMGHGAFQAESGEGSLFMEDERRRPLAVAGRELAAILSDCESIRLVFLNACDTATATADDRANPFAGVATALIFGGIPVVVAMQFPIADQSAVAFSAAFYRRLASGDTIDAAVTEGRQYLYMRDERRNDWLAPALFSRVAGEPVLRGAATGETSAAVSGVDEQYPWVKPPVFRIRREAPAVDRGDKRSDQQTESAGRAFEGVQSYTTSVLRQVESSYEEARKDARVWSVASLMAAGLGLGMVIAAVVSLFLSNREISVTSGIASVVSGAVSGLFFRQWRLASGRLATMVDDLAELRKLDFAQHVASTMETAAERDKARSAIVKALVNTVVMPGKARPGKEAHNQVVRADG